VVFPELVKEGARGVSGDMRNAEARCIYARCGMNAGRREEEKKVNGKRQVGGKSGKNRRWEESASGVNCYHDRWCRSMYAT
jgi:hypothetical protein